MLVALDVTDNVIDEAVSRGANLIVTHHPVIFHPMKRVTADTLVWRLVRAGLSVVSAHTNLDIARGRRQRHPCRAARACGHRAA